MFRVELKRLFKAIPEGPKKTAIIFPLNRAIIIFTN
ncbi:hypothetical protein FLACOL_02713 [Flavobacterium columnare]|uniref:Uncharacterized protein n=1 Tax=Flavobacterium columnare TaxID=996 RepID=A0A2N9PEC5_9FLAO|nr:hypothetical protein FLACOL_02713 [Flavobacterium columnare]